LQPERKAASKQSKASSQEHPCFLQSEKLSSSSSRGTLSREESSLGIFVSVSFASAVDTQNLIFLQAAFL
jgi:hypothetical protein